MNTQDNFSDYDDIIHLPLPQIWVRPRMSRSNRAAQFVPFAALSGFENMVRETENNFKGNKDFINK